MSLLSFFLWWFDLPTTLEPCLSDRADISQTYTTPMDVSYDDEEERDVVFSSLVDNPNGGSRLRLCRRLLGTTDALVFNRSATNVSRQ
jgi:hypothetical protein